MSSSDLCKHLNPCGIYTHINKVNCVFECGAPAGGARGSQRAATGSGLSFVSRLISVAHLKYLSRSNSGRRGLFGLLFQGQSITGRKSPWQNLMTPACITYAVKRQRAKNTVHGSSPESGATLWMGHAVDGSFTLISIVNPSWICSEASTPSNFRCLSS